jgi:hypothetical protein
VANQVSPAPCVLGAEDLLYHFVHYIGFHSDGTLNSAAFNLRSDPNLSVAIAKLIPGESFNEFCALMSYCGVAQLTVGSIRELGLDVRQEPNPKWGKFAAAHAVIHGYEDWTRRAKTDASRAWSIASNALGVLRRVPN